MSFPTTENDRLLATPSYDAALILMKHPGMRSVQESCRASDEYDEKMPPTKSAEASGHGVARPWAHGEDYYLSSRATRTYINPTNTLPRVVHASGPEFNWTSPYSDGFNVIGAGMPQPSFLFKMPPGYNVWTMSDGECVITRDAFFVVKENLQSALRGLASGFDSSKLPDTDDRRMAQYMILTEAGMIQNDDMIHPDRAYAHLEAKLNDLLAVHICNYDNPTVNLITEVPRLSDLARTRCANLGVINAIGEYSVRKKDLRGNFSPKAMVNGSRVICVEGATETYTHLSYLHLCKAGFQGCDEVYERLSDGKTLMKVSSKYEEVTRLHQDRAGDCLSAEEYKNNRLAAWLPWMLQHPGKYWRLEKMKMREFRRGTVLYHVNPAHFVNMSITTIPPYFASKALKDLEDEQWLLYLVRYDDDHYEWVMGYYLTFEARFYNSEPLPQHFCPHYHKPSKTWLEVFLCPNDRAKVKVLTQSLGLDHDVAKRALIRAMGDMDAAAEFLAGSTSTHRSSKKLRKRKLR